jgi:uncharacterized protein YjbI with pentapeptide repeats
VVTIGNIVETIAILIVGLGLSNAIRHDRQMQIGGKNLPPPQRSEGTRAPDAPSIVAPSDELQKLTKTADDLEAIKKAVDDAASVSGGLWLSYLFVLFYLAVAAGAVTHIDLFFEKAVKLPFLGIDLPLVAFFIVAPILFVIVHTYTLVHLVMLTDKAKRYHQALYMKIKDANGTVGERRKATRDKLRRQLPSNILIQFLAGPSDLREGAFGWLLWAIAVITVVVLPALLLLMIQIQSLPYQGFYIVWTQRIALLVDLAFVWWLWRKVLPGGESDSKKPWSSVIWVRIGQLSTLIAIVFSCAIATFPGELQEDLLAKWDQGTLAVTVHDMLFSREPNPETHRRFPFSNTLVLPGLNVYEGLGIDDPQKVKWRDFVFRPRGRDLRGAIFSFAILPRVDFTGAKLQGAQLDSAQLQGAMLDHAKLQGASLDLAKFQGAWLDSANLQGASLKSANLQGASLHSAQLQGASLTNADFQGADLSSAQLQGASLEQAHLQGAWFNDAQLQGASFSEAILKATYLRGAYLWRSYGLPTELSAIDVVVDNKTWQAWDVKDKAYEKLYASLLLLPSLSPRSRDLRTGAFARINGLDPASTPLFDDKPWRKKVDEMKPVQVKSYREALAESLQALFCPGDENEAFVVRAVAKKFNQLQKAGPAARDLIAELLNKNSSDCSVAASLTDADRATLLRIQQDIENMALEELGLENKR